jgi:hypothetical protein
MMPPPAGSWGMPPEVLQTLPGYGPDVAKKRAEGDHLIDQQSSEADTGKRKQTFGGNRAQVGHDPGYRQSGLSGGAPRADLPPGGDDGDPGEEQDSPLHWMTSSRGRRGLNLVRSY